MTLNAEMTTVATVDCKLPRVVDEEEAEYDRALLEALNPFANRTQEC
jgi:hypothetical protein